MKGQQLELTTLTAITQLDGRYRDRVKELTPYVSEYGLIKTRFEIEAKYLISLSEVGIVRHLAAKERKTLDTFGENLTLADAQKVKQIESETRHDVKAVERAFRILVKGTSLGDITEMIHLGLTSEDINNLAYRLMLMRATRKVCIPIIDSLIDQLLALAKKYMKTPMLARTHGQAAVPTTVGKEIVVFAARLNGQVRELKGQQLTGKLTGAVGNFNALKFSYPEIDWINFSAKFVNSLGFQPNLATTQINSYEDVIKYFQNIARICGVIIDFDQDIWRYISDDWFIQDVKSGEVGSSTMPQKVNPIDFENSEGNLVLSRGIFETLCRKLAISRLQRDLSDSTTIRNIATSLGFFLVGIKSTLTGLSRVRPNEEKISESLNRDWSILTEAVQTELRKEGVNDPYALIAKLSRGEHIDRGRWQQWLDSLPIKKDQKTRLKKLTPQTYTGLAVQLTDRTINEIIASRKK